MKALVFLSTLLTIFLSCGKKCYMTPPIPLYFLLKIDKQTFSDTVLKQLKFSYTKSGTLKYEPIGIIDSSKIMVISGINWLSKRANAKEFYLEYPDNAKKDTIFINFKVEKTACDDMYYELAEPIRFNGKVVDKFDTVFNSCRVYVFEK